ncbi:hypothetical protein SAMN05216578_10645 [Halopseudomonas formosensis]|jgi:hypothetical protein|uniref:Uncharacterized protein n=1 Tax=Halopseudomonas formosensis TaxID=1002526 RepID=A0A1I6BT22_9GAMM|nr:hypothetical protein [Halopseudomonas formosensis]NLC02418.1 hypothetical protein [Halopseudomonas formosensis]SFQ84007.1 hypothetical protein SAMN05216578_10645 [Halopseudomonas formosensis]
MGRKILQKQIQQLDEQLGIEMALLKLDGRERLAALKGVSPLYWIGGGLALGLLTGKLMGANGPRLLISQGSQLLRIGSLLMPGLAVATSPPESL